jgi:hypothetical protein
MQHCRGEENGGSSGSIGVSFPMRGRGWGPRSGLFSWARWGNCGEVGGASQGRRKRMRLGLLARGSSCGVDGPRPYI